MKCLSRNSSTLSAVGLAVAVGSLFLMSSSKPACAYGYFVFDNAIQTSRIVYSSPGSSAYFTPGQTTSASSYSYYSAGPTSSATSATASGGANYYFSWVNADGHSPSPTQAYDANFSGEIDGSASASGASAGSSASGVGGASAPPGYETTSGSYSYLQNPGIAPHVSASVSASTSAGPDNTADPQEEKYGNPTAAAAGASTNVTLTVHGTHV